MLWEFWGKQRAAASDLGCREKAKYENMCEDRCTGIMFSHGRAHQKLPLEKERQLQPTFHSGILK